MTSFQQKTNDIISTSLGSDRIWWIFTLFLTSNPCFPETDVIFKISMENAESSRNNQATKENQCRNHKKTNANDTLSKKKEKNSSPKLIRIGHVWEEINMFIAFVLRKP